MRNTLLLLTTTLSCELFSHVANLPGLPTVESPWFTGPLLAPSASVVPQGHQNYEPYLYYTKTTAHYDKHYKAHTVPHFTNVLAQATFQIGVAPATEFDFAPQFCYNHTQGVSDWRVSDMPFGIAFQLLRRVPGTWTPSIKLKLTASAPIGKYDHLDPRKKGTDQGGSGNWNPGIGVVTGNVFQFPHERFLSLRYYLTYHPSTPISVHGISAYGGTRHTRGTVYPGNYLLSDFAFEYNFTREFAVACDLLYIYQAKTRFSGKSGGLRPTSPHSNSLSLAPALEYNWSEKYGIIGGGWFTLTGQNASKFLSWVVAFNAYI